MAPTAAHAILCGDPARALLIAQAVLTEPRMSNHHRGLWGYWGRTSEGGELTVQATGIGGPSAAVVLGELADAGLEAAIRIGTCAATGAGLELGDAVVAERLDPGLTAELLARDAGNAGALVSVDIAPHRPTAADEPPAAGIARDMQTATLARVATERGVRFAAALIVVEAAGRGLEDDALEDRCERLGRIAAEALSVSVGAAASS
jgi:uridine phosphorylase